MKKFAKLILIFLLSTIMNGVTSYFFGDVFIFLIRELLLTLSVFLLYNYETEILDYIMESRRLDSILISKYPYLKYGGYVFFVFSFSFFFVVCFSDMVDTFIYRVAAFLVGSSFFFSLYKLYALVQTPEAHFTPQILTKSVGHKNYRGFSSSSQWAAYFKTYFGVSTSTLFSAVAMTYPLSKIGFGMDYRYPPASAFGYVLTGLKSDSDFAFNAANRVVNMYGEDAIPFITETDGCTVSFSKTLKYVIFKGDDPRLLFGNLYDSSAVFEGAKAQPPKGVFDNSAISAKLKEIQLKTDFGTSAEFETQKVLPPKTDG